jgi:hypothetical protein
MSSVNDYSGQSEEEPLMGISEVTFTDLPVQEDLPITDEEKEVLTAKKRRRTLSGSPIRLWIIWLAFWKACVLP